MTTFGDIVEPSTRTAWEDWDEITTNDEHTELKWQKEFTDIKIIEDFYIFEGKYLAARVQSQAKNLELINSIPTVNLLLYRTKESNKYICLIKDYNLVLSSEIVELMKGLLDKSKNVVAVLTKALSEYQNTDIHYQTCVIRSLCTSTSSQQMEFPKLEQPNIISGVAAGVITLREHLNGKGILLVCYMENSEEYQIEKIEKLLLKFDIPIPLDSKPVSNSILSSNLYI